MKDLFEMGVSFRTFLLNQENKNRTKFMKYYIPMDIRQEHRDRIAKIDTPVNILGVVEGWSADDYLGLAVLEKLISTNSNIRLRLVTKNDIEDKLTDYLKDGSVNGLAFIFLDDNFNMKASFVEKSEQINKDEAASKLIDQRAAQLLELIEKTS